MIAFAFHIERPNGPGAWLFFVGLGLGLLAKGPIAVVLVAMPVAVWAIWCRDIGWLWRSLPWFRGTLLTAVIAGPWYLSAEVSSPGFLEYFLIGEHFYRFIDSGWTGDLYGNAHARPPGTIWLYGLVGLLPWSLVAVYAVVRARLHRPQSFPANDQDRFLILAATSPLVFFTLAGNVLPAYVMPCLPALAALLGPWLAQRSRTVAVTGLLSPLLVATLFGLGTFGDFDYRSQKNMLAAIEPESPEGLVYYFGKMPHSASFYSGGSTMLIRNQDELEQVLASLEGGTLLVPSKEERALGSAALSCLTLRDIRDRYSIFDMEPCLVP